MRETRRGMIDKILSTHLYYLIMAENSSDISKKIEKVMLNLCKQIFAVPACIIFSHNMLYYD